MPERKVVGFKILDSFCIQNFSSFFWKFWVWEVRKRTNFGLAVTGQTGGRYRLDRSSSARAVAASRRLCPRVDRPAILGLQMSTFLSIHGARFSFSFFPSSFSGWAERRRRSSGLPRRAGHSPPLRSDSVCPDPLHPTPHPRHPSPSLAEPFPGQIGPATAGRHYSLTWSFGRPSTSTYQTSSARIEAAGSSSVSPLSSPALPRPASTSPSPEPARPHSSSCCSVAGALASIPGPNSRIKPSLGEPLVLPHHTPAAGVASPCQTELVSTSSVPTSHGGPRAAIQISAGGFCTVIDS